ncbi:MAG TPA: hypothetical protein PKJ47_13515 [Candidatus Limiplasma sp.]|nr:hypothetical protein [Candidatus Limiplasma sp.]
MKKLLALILALSLLGSSALAVTVTVDLDTATLQQLVDAQTAIGDRISALRKAQAPASEGILLSGSGTSIQSGVEIAQVPARLTITGKVKVTLSGGAFDYTYNSWQDSASCDAITEAGTFDMLIEGEGDWTIAVDPLVDGGTLALSGTGPAVSDFFPLSAATIVHVVMDATTLDDYSASLYCKLGSQYENIDAWSEDTVVGDSLFSSPLKLEGDGIIKPVKGRDRYYWVMNVPIGATWSITAK